MKSKKIKQAVITSLFIIVPAVFFFIFRFSVVDGQSMENTYKNGDVLIVYSFGKPERNDIIAFEGHYKDNTDKNMIKRVIAVGGDTVDIDFDKNEVYVNGEKIDEPYIKEQEFESEGRQFPCTLEDDELFVMGDNRNHSTDGRSSDLEPVRLKDVKGTVLFRL